MRFKDKVVVVIGGNSGIGLASAIEFANEGAKVVISGRNQTTIDAAAKEIGADVLAVKSDVSDLTQLDSLMAQVKEKHGHIDVLFVNAGIGSFKPIAEIDEAYWENMIGINLKGPFFAAQKALPLMLSGGAIIFTSSIGHVKGIPGNSVYAASKAGLRALTRNIGAEVVERGIRVNCMSPGPIETPLFNRSGIPEEALVGLKQSITDSVPMKRFGTAQEVAKTVLFLASEDSSYVTGVDLFVDGGTVSF